MLGTGTQQIFMEVHGTHCVEVGQKGLPGVFSEQTGRSIHGSHEERMLHHAG